jgi:hypothetical protein
MFLGVIVTLFPHARIIHCRRDPLDTCLSCYFQSFTEIHYSYRLEDIGSCFLHYERLMAHWRQVLPTAIHEVKYEYLIAAPQLIIRNLLTFCGLDWDDHCLAFHRSRRIVQTASQLQVRRPMSADSIGRWKRYRAYLNPLLQSLCPAASDAR